MDVLEKKIKKIIIPFVLLILCCLVICCCLSIHPKIEYQINFDSQIVSSGNHVEENKNSVDTLKKNGSFLYVWFGTEGNNFYQYAGGLITSLEPFESITLKKITLIINNERNNIKINQTTKFQGNQKLKWNSFPNTVIYEKFIFKLKTPRLYFRRIFRKYDMALYHKYPIDIEVTYCLDDNEDVVQLLSEGTVTTREGKYWPQWIYLLPGV